MYLSKNAASGRLGLLLLALVIGVASSSCQSIGPEEANVLHINSATSYNRYNEDIRVRLGKVVRESDRRIHLFLDGFSSPENPAGTQTLEVALMLESSDGRLVAGTYALNEQSEYRCRVTLRTRRGTVAVGSARSNVVEVHELNEKQVAGRFLLDDGMTRITGLFSTVIP